MKRRALLLAVLSVLTAFASSFPADEAAVRRRLSAGIQAIRLIDTHEHLPPESERLKRDGSLFTVLHYVSSDMWADGLEKARADRVFRDPSALLESKWELAAPYWANVRTTAYGRALLRAVRDLYGVADINESTYRELSRKIKEANLPGRYETVLGKRAGIDLAICDIGGAGTALDPNLFRAVLRMDQYLAYPYSAPSEGKRLGITIGSLTDWEGALDQSVRLAKEQKFVGIKSGIAYSRSLDFQPVNREEAEALFNHLRDRKGMPTPSDLKQLKPLQDYMFGKIAEACARYDLPLQIHTGFFYDMGRNVTQADPSLLIPFVIRHRQTRFVLMHGGYPYGGQLLAMAKNLSNVLLDMCWTYVISPTFAGRFLDEAIETVPADKILGFGGDYEVVEGAYAHAVMCREVVAKVLADKVLAGYWSEEEALRFARGILRDNAIRTFKIQP